MSKSSGGWAFLGKLVGGVVITGAAVYGGVRIYAAIPPKPLTSDEQAKLRSAGVVWASPDAPLPAGVEHMVLLSKDVALAMAKAPDGGASRLSPANAAEVITVGPIRLAKLVAAGWKFWRPKTPEDTAKESVAALGAKGKMP